MFKVSEGNVSLQLQQFLQFVPVTGSRELEGKAAKGGVGGGNLAPFYSEAWWWQHHAVGIFFRGREWETSQDRGKDVQSKVQRYP
jgi:hypothetical protein